MNVYVEQIVGKGVKLEGNNVGASGDGDGAVVVKLEGR